MRRISQICQNALLVATVVLGACSIMPVHRVDVRQGNALDDDAVERLEVGMNPEQVRYLLGNPVIDDSYHTNRWDYVYYYNPGEGRITHRKLTVFCENGQVVRIAPRKASIDG